MAQIFISFGNFPNLVKIQPKIRVSCDFLIGIKISK